MHATDFAPKGRDPPTLSGLLNDYLLLQSIHSAFGILCRDCDRTLSRGQRWRKEMETPVGPYHRDFMAVHHHACSDLSLSGQFDDVPMLDEGIEVEVDNRSVLAAGDQRKAVLLALQRFFSVRILRLHRPVIGAFQQSGNHY